MEEVSLKVEMGRAVGTRPARRLRREGKVPAVFYGHGREALSLAVDRRELQAVLSTEAGLNALITLEVDGERHTAMARQLQRDPIMGSVTHLDFVAVSADQVVITEVPLHLVGEAEQVRINDGIVDQLMHSITVKAKALAIPSGIDVDISELTIGGAVRVGDLTLPEGVEAEHDPEEPVVMGSLPAVEAPPEEAEAAEGEAAEGAAPEGGAAAPAPAAAGEGGGEG